MSLNQVPTHIRVNVTANDIRRGEPSNMIACPVARAAKRAFKTTVRAWSGSLVVDHGGTWMVPYKLPDEVSAFIDEFDRNGTGLPFSFVLESKAP